MSFGSESEEHPRPEELLSFADGEISHDRNKEIQAHLTACWQCRTELDHQQAAIRQFMDYRDQWITPALPSRQQDIVALRHKLRESKAADTKALNGGGIAHRLRTALTVSMRPVRTIAAGVILAILAFLWYSARPLPTVSANELVQRASESEEKPSPEPFRQTVRLRAGRRSVTRQVWRGAAAPTTSLTRGADDALLSSALAGAGWDPADPLSARHFRIWRDRAKRTTDVVKLSGQRLLTLTTSASDTPLFEASLTVRVSDFHTVGQTLRFRHPVSEEKMEISIEEIAWEPETLPSPAVASNTGLPTLPEPEPLQPAESSAPSPPLGRSLDDQEADARWTFHQLGFDAGEPIEVKRDGTRIVLENSGLTAEREKELRAALPDVLIIAPSPHIARDRAVEPAVSAATVTGQPLVSPLTWETKFAGTGERREFANRVVEKTEEALLRAHALARLTERYSSVDLEKLSPEARGHILEIERDHATVLCRQITALRDLLAAVVDPPASRSSPASQPLLPVVQKIDLLANILFAQANTTLDASQAASDLAASLAEAETQCTNLKEVR